MSKWLHDNEILGADMVMKMKKAALDDPLDNPISKITGCGVAVVADRLDALLMDWIHLTSECADNERMLILYKGESREWTAFGFDRCPTEYSAERQAELRALAKRWNDEDEAEMDAEGLAEIEERRQRRETQR